MLSFLLGKMRRYTNILHLKYNFVGLEKMLTKAGLGPWVLSLMFYRQSLSHGHFILKRNSDKSFQRQHVIRVDVYFQMMMREVRGGRSGILSICHKVTATVKVRSLHHHHSSQPLLLSPVCTKLSYLLPQVL